jgi:hypothetical protein
MTRTAARQQRLGKGEAPCRGVAEERVRTPADVSVEHRRNGREPETRVDPELRVLRDGRSRKGDVVALNGRTVSCRCARPADIDATADGALDAT